MREGLRFCGLDGISVLNLNMLVYQLDKWFSSI